MVLGAIIPRYACIRQPHAIPSQLPGSIFFVFSSSIFCFFEYNVAFYEYFCTFFTVFSLNEQYVVIFSFRMVFFYLPRDRGLEFLH